MSFVDNNQVPGDARHHIFLRPHKVIRTNYGSPVVFERILCARLAQRIEDIRVKNQARDEELVAQLLRPLLPKRRGNYDENLPPSFRPKLTDDETGLNRLAQANFIGKNCASREGRPKSK